MNTYRCPHCRKRSLSVAEPGDDVVCPTCGAEFTAPRPVRSHQKRGVGNATGMQIVGALSVMGSLVALTFGAPAAFFTGLIGGLLLFGCGNVVLLFNDILGELRGVDDG